jgi:WD40 repeat protein
MKVDPSGKRLAVLAGHTLYLWDAEENRPLHMVERPGHFAAIRCVAQHVGAGLVASGDADGNILLWERNGTLRTGLLGHSRAVAALAFRPDGGGLASASADGAVVLWQLDGKRVWSYQDQKPGTVFRCLVFHPRAPIVAAGTNDGRVVVIDGGRGEALASRTPDGSAVRALIFLGDGTLAAGTEAGTVHFGAAPDWAMGRGWPTGSAVTGLAFLRDSDLLVSAGNTIQFWQRATGRRVWALEVPQQPVRSLTLDELGHRLAVADQGNNVLTFDLRDLNRQLEKLSLAVPGLPLVQP